nr:hypothetical protein [Streptomyces sp. SCL15-4]
MTEQCQKGRYTKPVRRVTIAYRRESAGNNGARQVLDLAGAGAGHPPRTLGDPLRFSVNAMKSAFIPFDERRAVINDVVKAGYAGLKSE